MMLKNKYPIPLVQDLFDQLNITCYFTKLDIRSGYHQVKVMVKGVEKMTCVTHYGTFEFLVMPSELMNALGTFYTFLNQAFHDYLYKLFVAYLDDIVVYNSALEEHTAHLKSMFERLRQHQLYVK